MSTREMNKREYSTKIPNIYDRAISRFADLLECVNAPKGSSIYQISARAGLPKSTGYRHFETLEQHRFTNRSPSGEIALGELGWHIGFSAWGFGDVSPFAATTIRYLRTQSRRTSFLGVLVNRTLQITAYSASRGLSFRPVPAEGVYIVSDFDGSQGNILVARDHEDNTDYLIQQEIAKSDFGIMTLGTIGLSSDDASELLKSGVLSDTAHRLRVALGQDLNSSGTNTGGFSGA